MVYGCLRESDTTHSPRCTVLSRCTHSLYSLTAPQEIRKPADDAKWGSSTNCSPLACCPACCPVAVYGSPCLAVKFRKAEHEWGPGHGKVRSETAFYALDLVENPGYVSD